MSSNYLFRATTLYSYIIKTIGSRRWYAHNSKRCHWWPQVCHEILSICLQFRWYTFCKSLLKKSTSCRSYTQFWNSYQLLVIMMALIIMILDTMIRFLTRSKLSGSRSVLTWIRALVLVAILFKKSFKANWVSSTWIQCTFSPKMMMSRIVALPIVLLPHKWNG